MKTSIVLFTRDLRLHDHPALRAAARHSDRVVPAFVIDRRLVCGRPGTPNRLAFLLESLRDLDRSLRDRGSALVIRRGDVVTEVMRLAREGNSVEVFMSEDVSGYARSRRRRLERACGDAGLSLKTFGGVTVIPPGELTPASGDHYRVFTPYWRAWRAATKREVLGAPRSCARRRGCGRGGYPGSRTSPVRTSRTTCRPAASQRVASSSVGGFGTARGSTSTGPMTCRRTPRRT